MGRLRGWGLVRLALLPSLARCLVHNLDVVQDKRGVFLIESFGFQEGGRLNLTVSDFSVYSKSPEYRTGFAIVRTQNEGLASQILEDAYENDSICLLDRVEDADIHEGQGWIMDMSKPSTWMRSHAWRQIGPGEKGLYSLMFVRCQPRGLHVPVSFHLQAIFVNPGPDYLDAGSALLPQLYLCFFVLFALALLLWARTIRQGAENKAVHAVHHMMTVLLVFKTMALLTEGIHYHYLSVGGGSQAWIFFFYVFSFLKGTTLFVVILLIGTGWSLLKPSLSTIEKQALIVLLLLQVIDNIAMVVVEQRAPGSFSWLAWCDVLHILDFVCWVAILVPIMCSIRNLKNAMSASDGKAADSIARLNRFRHLYMLVFAYIYFTRIIVFLLAATLPFDLLWLQQLFTEGATLCFYVVIGYKFRPQIHASYSPVLEDDENDQL